MTSKITHTVGLQLFFSISGRVQTPIYIRVWEDLDDSLFPKPPFLVACAPLKASRHVLDTIGCVLRLSRVCAILLNG